MLEKFLSVQDTLLLVAIVGIALKIYQLTKEKYLKQ